MPGEPVPGHGQRGGDARRPGEREGYPAGDGDGYLAGDGGGCPAAAGGGFGPDGRPAGGGDWWPAEDFEEPWPDYAAMAPRDVGSAGDPDMGPARGLDTGPDADPDGGLDGGFLSRDPVPGQPARSGFSSGGASDTALPGPALARSLDQATRDGHKDLDDDELIGVLAGWQRTEGWAAAGRLAAVAELAARRPALTRAEAATRAGERAGWTKFCADEVAVALALSRRAAERMVPLAQDLATRLPRTRQALAGGVIGDYKAQLIAEATRVLEDAAAAEAEAAVVPDAVTGKTPGQIRASIGRAVLKADPGAAKRRREEAEKDPRVELWREDAGTAAICGYGLPADTALAADQAITTAALGLKAAGVAGTMDQLRARAYLDALLGMDSRPAAPQATPSAGSASTADPVTQPASAAAPGAGPSGTAVASAAAPGTAAPGTAAPGTAAASAAGTEPGSAGPPGPGRAAGQASPAVAINLTIPLTTLLGLTDHPGQAAGYGPIDADLARTLAAQATGNPSTTWCITVTDAYGHPTAHGCATPTRRGKRRRSKRPGGRPPGNRTEPADADGGPSAGGSGPSGGHGTWRLHIPGSGQDLTADLEPLAVIGCDHRHQTTAHDPSRKLRHLVEIRDGDCTFPPCLRDARRCDFEHTIAWEAGGRTCACNAGPRCRHHHHQKQAAGWTLEQIQPGYHTWTTPAGRRYATEPTTYPI